MAVIYVKPAQPNVRTRDPDDPRKALLPPYGKPVEDGPFWRRRLAEGAVVKTTKEEVETGEQAAAATHRAQLDEGTKRRDTERKAAQAAKDAAGGDAATVEEKPAAGKPGKKE